MLNMKIIGSGLLGLFIITTAYFAVSSYRNIVKKNNELIIKVKSLEQDKKKSDQIIKTIDTNNKNTTHIIERTREIEKVINNVPKTSKCIDTPAIHSVIEQLRINDQTTNNTEIP